MPTPSRIEPRDVLAILKEGDLDALLGCVEWAQFECKKAPYQLATDSGKFELAKDVSGMANAEGGIIVVGVGTSRDETSAAEFVNKVSLLTEERANIKQHIDVLQKWIYPYLRTIRIEWFQSKGGKEGVVAIYVPAASRDERPVVVTRLLEEGEVRGNAVAIFERYRDGAEPRTAQSIHTALRDEARQRDLLEKLEILQTSVDEITRSRSTTPPHPAPESFHRSSSRASSNALVSAPSLQTTLTNLSEVGLANRPAFVLDAAPVAPVSAPDFFASRQSPFAKLVDSPPEIRSTGFGIDAGLNARVHAGVSWRSMAEERLLEIAKDGTARFAASAGSSFLCWASKSEDKLQINPIALIESTYLFVELLHQLQALFEPRNVGYGVTLRLYHLISDRHAIGLVEGSVSSFWRGRRTTMAREAYFESTNIWASGEIVPAQFSYQIITSVYEWFGLTHDSIPYVREVGGAKVVDIEEIKRARG